jgi:hypothetical protein
MSIITEPLGVPACGILLVLVVPVVWLIDAGAPRR